jgi:peptide/nickel transport system permease protein
MSAHKSNIAFAAGRFKEFLIHFKRSKRGVLGVAIVCFFLAVAMVAPFVAPYDPLMPRWSGYFPADPPPAAADVCVPNWYKYIPGLNRLSENLEPIVDHELSSPSTLGNWSIGINNPQLATAAYNAVNGSLNDGCLEISYRRPAGEAAPGETVVTLEYNFTYPYPVHPKAFWIHLSRKVFGDVSEDLSLHVNFSFRRTDTSPLTNYTYKVTRTEGPYTIYEYPLIDYKQTIPRITWLHEWTRSRHPTIFFNPKWYQIPEQIIMPREGNYTFVTCITFDDKGANGEKAVTVYLDNLDLLIYGNSFGLLGTDDNMASPRDVFSSLLWGSRVSISIGLLTATISVCIGLTVGLTAGYSKGLTDELLMRLADLLMVLPTLPLLIVLSFILSPSMWNVVGILSFMGWMGFSRSVRSMTLTLRERTFVEAAKVVGATRGHILFKHILPNVFPLVYLALATAVPGAIVAEASLSFLGLFDPNVMSWGRVINEFSRSGIATTKGFDQYWFWVLPPGICISALAISFILVGYALDEMLNPRLRMRR